MFVPRVVGKTFIFNIVKLTFNLQDLNLLHRQGINVAEFCQYCGISQEK